MPKRKKVGSKKSRRDFVKKSGVHPKNIGGPSVMRGGYRL